MDITKIMKNRLTNYVLLFHRRAVSVLGYATIVLLLNFSLRPLVRESQILAILHSTLRGKNSAP